MSKLTESIDVRLVSSLEKVFPDDAPNAEGEIKKLSALWGESISFQVAYNYSSLFGRWVDIEVSSEISEHVSVRRVELVPSTYPRHGLYDDDYLRTSLGMYPDLLRELSDNKIKLIPDQWRSLWVEIDVTENIPEGEYPVKIEFKNDNHEVEAEVEVLVEVIGIKLPELRIKHTEWFHGDCLADYYGIEVFSERHWEIMESFITTAVKRNSNMLLVPIFTPPLDTAVGGERTTIQLVDVRVDDGKYSFEFGRLKRFMSMPSYRNRILGVQLYKYKITGFLHWGYNFYNSQFSLEHINPYEDTSASEAFPSGDTFLVYPGADGKPEESIRIMVLSQAFDDYRAMQLLEEIHGREKVLELIEDASNEITFTEYPRSASYLLDLREKINAAIKA